MVFASVPQGDLVWTKGSSKLKSVRSSSFGHRIFCGECGTPFLMRADHQPETVDFSVATLDDPQIIEPGFHIFWKSRINWLKIEDGLPKHDRFRTETPELNGTEPPQA
jgi:hypothetical protein